MNSWSFRLVFHIVNISYSLFMLQGAHEKDELLKNKRKLSDKVRLNHLLCCLTTSSEAQEF